MQFGYLGLGNMGLPMATRLLDAGQELHLFDIRDEAVRPLLDRQARRAETPKALADVCGTVAVSLPTLKIFQNVLTAPDGLLAGGAIKTLINTCTVGSAFAREMAALCAARGVTFIDAPISGGPSGARAGTLAVMVSGDPATVDALTPIFNAWGTTVVVAGDEPGMAQVLKLTNNILCIVAFVATSEAMTMSRQARIPDATMLQVLNNGTGRNFATTHLFPLALDPASPEFGATIEVLMKDFDLAMELGEELRVPMWVCQSVRLFLKQAMNQGRAGQDVTRLVDVVTHAMRGI